MSNIQRCDYHTQYILCIPTVESSTRPGFSGAGFAVVCLSHWFHCVRKAQSSPDKSILKCFQIVLDCIFIPVPPPAGPSVPTFIHHSEFREAAERAYTAYRCCAQARLILGQLRCCSNNSIGITNSVFSLSLTPEGDPINVFEEAFLVLNTEMYHSSSDYFLLRGNRG